MLVARDDPLDTYLVTHPEALHRRSRSRRRSSTRRTRYVLGPHLCAAAQELPLTEADLPLFGPTAREVVDALTDARAAAAAAARLVLDRPPAGPRPRRHPVGRRVAGAADRGRHRAGSIGTVDAGECPQHRPRRARSTCTGARPGWSSDLDLEEHVAVDATAPNPTTPPRRGRSPTSRSSRSASAEPWGDCRLSLGEVDVTHQVVVVPQAPPARAARCSARSRSTCPSASLRTTAVWWTVPDDVARRGRASPRSTCRAPRTRPSTARSACCRSSRPATAGTSAASPPRVHPDTGAADRLRLRRPPGRRRLRRARVPRGRRLADRDARGDRVAASAPTAARRASSRRSAATRTTRSTRPAPLALLDALLAGAPRVDG